MNELKRTVPTSFDEVRARIPEALKTEGFGVLTEIDVQETMKKKLGADFRRYRILGACNPPLAKQALDADLDVGRFLPCNVVVYENDDGGTTVLAIDPTTTIAAAKGDARLQSLADDVRARLERVLERLPARAERRTS